MNDTTKTINAEGWHDIVSWLPINLAARLEKLAEGGHSPAFAGVDPGRWRIELIAAATALASYGEAVAAGNTPDDNARDGAKAALHWVAYNLEHLWH